MKLKVLCLHGFGTNGNFLKMQTTSLQQDLRRETEFIFVDAPFVVPAEMIMDERVSSVIQGEHRSWFEVRSRDKSRLETDLLNAMQKIKTAVDSYSDHYDGILGFSQGAALAFFLLEKHAKGQLNWPTFNKIKFFLNFSGEPWRTSIRRVNYKRYDMPSIHYLSEEDFVFASSLYGPTLFKNAEIVLHTFGHRFPKLGLKEKDQIVLFLKKAIKNTISLPPAKL